MTDLSFKIESIKAFIFDLNGTMIDDMEYHLNAWFEMLNDDLGAELSLDEVRAQMYGKNSELLTRVFGSGRFTEQEMKEISLEKERRYQKAFRPHLALLPGLDAFLKKSESRHIPMGIGSAAIPFNIDFVLDNLNIRPFFKAVVSAEDVKKSKPDPETFLKAAIGLHQKPEFCLVFEDAPQGVEAALNAGMLCVVITSMHAKTAFKSSPNILHFIEDYTDPFLEKLTNRSILENKSQIRK